MSHYSCRVPATSRVAQGNSRHIKVPGSTQQWQQTPCAGAQRRRFIKCSAARSDEEGLSPEERTQKVLQLANEALSAAEDSALNLHKLPSAKEPKKVPQMLKTAGKTAVYLIACTIVWASHCRSLQVQYAVAFLTSALIGLRGIQKQSLDTSGAIAAALVGGATLGSSLQCGATLLAFFFASSELTRYAEDQKDNDEDFKAGGQRTWLQVFCNAFVPCVLAVLLARQTAGRDVLLSSGMPTIKRLMGAFLGYFACCCGDTWGSEIGQLAKQQPRLITTGRLVRAGTNGGVSLLGLGASAAGGCFVGAVFWAVGIISPSLWPASWRAAAAQWQLIPFGLVLGLVGSLIDSVLGATVQYTGIVRGKVTSHYTVGAVHVSGVPLLSNNAVNFVSASLCALLGYHIIALV